MGETTVSTYRVEIKNEDGTEGYSLHSTTTSRAEAMRKSQDLAAAGYDGRVITDKGYVSQEWSVNR